MKKAISIIKNILVWAVVLTAVGMMIFTIISVNTFNRNDRSLFGYKAYIVLSDSMSKTDFDAGDLILVKERDDYSKLDEGEIISYVSQNSFNFGEVVTHKIRKAAKDQYGNPGYITYGTTTDTDDEKVVTYPYILGVYEKCIPKVGTFFNFLKTTPGYIICILLPFLFLIGVQGINCVKLFRKYKGEQLEEIAQQKKELEQEREKSKEMMEELMALKKQLGDKLSEDSPSAETTHPDEAVEVIENPEEETEGAEV